MLRISLATLALAAVVRPSPGDEVDKPIRGTVQAGVHSFEVEPDAAYVATVSSEKTAVSVLVTGVNAQPQFDFSGGQKDKVVKTEYLFSPVKKGTARVRVAPGFDSPAGPQEYSLAVKRFALEKKPLLQEKGVLTNKTRAGPGKMIQKRFPLKLSKDRLYVAEVAIDRDFINPCPGFETARPPVQYSSYSVAGYEGKVGRLVYRPSADLDFQVTAGIFDELQANQTCQFTLTVYQTAGQ